MEESHEKSAEIIGAADGGDSGGPSRPWLGLDDCGGCPAMAAVGQQIDAAEVVWMGMRTRGWSEAVKWMRRVENLHACQH